MNKFHCFAYRNNNPKGSKNSEHLKELVFTEKNKALTQYELRKKCPYLELYFPAFGLNTERYFISLHIQSECGKNGPE